MTEHPLRDEIFHTAKTLVALMRARDQHYDEDGEDPIDCMPQLIKTAGHLRGELDDTPPPREWNTDPEDLFNDDKS